MYKGSETLSRRLRCAIGIFYGRWYLPIPNKIRLTVLLGKPINVAQIEDPDASQVAFVYLCFDLHFNSVNTDDDMHRGCFVSCLTLCDMQSALQIEKLHAEVVQQVKDLYYSHRHLHGWEDRELEIV